MVDNDSHIKNEINHNTSNVLESLKMLPHSKGVKKLKKKEIEEILKDLVDKQHYLDLHETYNDA